VNRMGKRLTRVRTLQRDLNSKASPRYGHGSELRQAVQDVLKIRSTRTVIGGVLTLALCAITCSIVDRGASLTLRLRMDRDPETCLKLLQTTHEMVSLWDEPYFNMKRKTVFPVKGSSADCCVLKEIETFDIKKHPRLEKFPGLSEESFRALKANQKLFLSEGHLRNKGYSARPQEDFFVIIERLEENDGQEEENDGQEVHFSIQVGRVGGQLEEGKSFNYTKEGNGKDSFFLAHLVA